MKLKATDNSFFLFSAYSVPGAPGMSVQRYKTSLFVTVTKVFGLYTVERYCMAVIEKNDTRCLTVSHTNFSGLSAQTNYTVQGWITNGDNLVGNKATRIISTLTDSKSFCNFHRPIQIRGVPVK